MSCFLKRQAKLAGANLEQPFLKEGRGGMALSQVCVGFHSYCEGPCLRETTAALRCALRSSGDCTAARLLLYWEAWLYKTPFGSCRSGLCSSDPTRGRGAVGALWWCLDLNWKEQSKWSAEALKFICPLVQLWAAEFRSICKMDERQVLQDRCLLCTWSSVFHSWWLRVCTEPPNLKKLTLKRWRRGGQ